MDPPTILRIVPGQDPALLREFVSAHLAHERAGLLRDLLVHLLAALSALVWVAAVRPAWLGPAGADSVLGVWAVFAVGAAGSAVSEVRWRRQTSSLRRRLENAPTPP